MFVHDEGYFRPDPCVPNESSFIVTLPSAIVKSEILSPAVENRVIFLCPGVTHMTNMSRFAVHY
jgi:hypothetical protein